MQSRKRSNPLKVTDVTRKVQAKICKYLGASEMSDAQLSLGADIPLLLTLYPDVTEFRAAYLLSEMMSKYAGLDIGTDRVSAALTAFVASESTCLETNLRLQWSCKEYGVDAVLMTARRLLHSLFGEFSLDEMSSSMAFTSGASTRLQRRNSLPPMKYSAGKKLHVTRLCLPYALAAIRSSHCWTELLLSQHGSIEDAIKVVPGNRITTVPKNAKTDRIIAIEPDLNMYCQKGIGGMIRRRLRKVGVNLNSQAKNQHYAREGSKYGELATIDLKAASDSISIELVKLLLPEDWFRHIMSTRSPMGALPSGDFVTFQKISSMGNGYTFELESALFWAISKATLLCSHNPDRRLAIFGDDIVINTDSVDLLIRVFRHVGFETNQKKSFWQGPFRESCGKHFVNGVDVTPFYIRRPIDSVPRLYWICNQFRRWATAPLGFGSKSSFELWRSLRNHIPKRWQFVIPEGIGDVGVLGTLSESPPTRRRRVVGLIPKEYRIEPGAFLMYIYTLDSFRSRTSSLTEGCKAGDSELLTRAVPDRYQLNRFRLSGWTDPGFWVSDLEGPVGLV